MPNNIHRQFVGQPKSTTQWQSMPIDIRRTSTTKSLSRSPQRNPIQKNCTEHCRQSNHGEPLATLASHQREPEARAGVSIASLSRGHSSCSLTTQPPSHGFGSRCVRLLGSHLELENPITILESIIIGLKSRTRTRPAAAMTHLVDILFAELAGRSEPPQLQLEKCLLCSPCSIYILHAAR
ncbi:hypothetical protein J3458_019873 [Metarhizium acridum]|uniref:uncharacterized protein n=1 Tax=Metarhizium acridum TaxID=92637 RepID=UPI001C6D2237|nr:hypothetical protein J3458_019873 [Metarhizium acridum]